MSGAAGGGKSEALLEDAYKNALKYKNCKIIMFRRTFPDLERSLILRSREKYDLRIAKYNESKRRWFFKNGSMIEFAYMDKESDVFNYQGAEYDFIYWDELTHFTESQYRYMTSRLRGSAPIKRQIKAATNPGGVGHSWVKGRFIDIGESEKIHKPIPTEDDPKPGTRCFIPAKINDNQELLQADPDYLRRLQSLPTKERKQLLEGDWDSFSGQAFDEWNREIHVIKPFAIPDTWKKFRAIDYGRTAPFACLWGAIDQDSNLYIYREAYQAGLDATDQADLVLSLSQGEKIEWTVLDSACWIPNQHGESIADTYEDRGLTCEKASKNRLNGKDRVHAWLKVNEGQSKLKIFSTCSEFIKHFPTLTLDPRNPEDIDTHHPHDHCFIAGTLVETDKGQIPIENIKLGDMVLTRDGYHEVINSGVTNENATVYTVYFSNGSTLTGTGNHPIWVENKGFLPLDSLRYGDIIEVSPNWRDDLCQSKELPTMDIVTEGIQNLRIYQTRDILKELPRVARRLNISITQYGKIITGRSLKDITSIIKTGIQSTTISRILNVFRPTNIYHTMPIIKWNALLNISKILGRLRLNGINRKLGANGIVNMGNEHGPVGNPLLRLVKNAEVNLIPSRDEIMIDSAPITASQSGEEKVEWMTKQDHAQNAAMSSLSIDTAKQEPVPKNAKYVLGIVLNSEKRKVYNLSVDTVPEYFANGILVHNCYDAMRYMLMNLPDPRTFEPYEDNAMSHLANSNQDHLPFALRDEDDDHISWNDL